MQLINNMLRPKSIENCVIRGLIMADANIKKLPNCINFVLENRVNIVGISRIEAQLLLTRYNYGMYMVY